MKGNFDKTPEVAEIETKPTEPDSKDSKKPGKPTSSTIIEASEEKEPSPQNGDDFNNMSEAEKNLYYVLLEYCVPFFPSGIVMRYKLSGVRDTVLGIPKRKNFAGLESPSSERIFALGKFELPVELAKRLLEVARHRVDKGLVMLRYKLSKRRVREMTFWERYFTELVISVRNYVCNLS
eukprot:672435-Amorphochlora_amoeboformis.AAC.1